MIQKQTLYFQIIVYIIVLYTGNSLTGVVAVEIRWTLL
jgi:hypothetical protein